MPLLFDLIRTQSVVAIDTSTKCLNVAKRTRDCEQAQFLAYSQYKPSEQIDLAYSNETFHHIPPTSELRQSITSTVHCGPGGSSRFENNPWNLGTRYVMSRIPFDRDAIPLTPSEARHLLQAGGFEALRTDFLLILPRELR
jgi:trans-aconitate methyltransferase